MILVLKETPIWGILPFGNCQLSVSSPTYVPLMSHSSPTYVPLKRGEWAEKRQTCIEQIHTIAVLPMADTSLNVNNKKRQRRLYPIIHVCTHPITNTAL